MQIHGCCNSYRNFVFNLRSGFCSFAHQERKWWRELVVWFLWPEGMGAIYIRSFIDIYIYIQLIKIKIISLFDFLLNNFGKLILTGLVKFISFSSCWRISYCPIYGERALWLFPRWIEVSGCSKLLESV